MARSFFLTFFAHAACVLIISCSVVYADEQDYAGQEKIIPETQKGVAPYTATVTIPKDPSFTYKLVFGDGTPEGTVVCRGRATCSTVRVSHTYASPGLYVVELYRVYADDDGKITAKSLRGLAGRAYVEVGDAVPVVVPPQCKQWFNGCVACSRSVRGGELSCPKKVCYGARKPQVCNEEFYINKIPTVRVTGPASTTEGIAREWRITARDYENEKMTYAIRWGDETDVQKREKLRQSSATTFTHTYTAPGVYTLTAFVKDASGGIGRASQKVTVRDAYAGVVCTKEYVPVCGEKDGELQTYSNECSLNKARAKKKHAGAC